jgi:hypothetical protein
VQFVATVSGATGVDGLAVSGFSAPAELPQLLVCDYVSDELGKQLRARGICYADAVGNAWVSHPETELLAVIQGCARPKVEAQSVSSGLQVDHMRLLFQLIVEPVIATYSAPDLAAHTNIPLVVVTRVLRSLTAQGMWLDDAALGLGKLRDLATYWVSHYSKTLRNRLNGHRYRWRDPAAQANWHRLSLPADSLWSGEAAAHQLLAKAELPTSFTLYSRLPRLKLAQHLGLVPHTHGNIELLNSFFPTTSFTATDRQCVRPFLVYADLLERQVPHCEELAQQIYNQFLVNLLKK